MAPSHSRPRKKRIEVDVLFAPVPQALVLDTAVSAAACRLWSVLYVFRWNDRSPDFDKLAEALGTTERSVYRWLQELEATGWILWDRNASLLDRFTLRMSCEPPGIDTDVNSDPEELILRSNKLILRSKRLTQVSEELTQVSISDLFDGTPMPQNDRLSSDQNHEKIQKGGDARASVKRSLPKNVPRHVAYLVEHEMMMAAEFGHLDPDATIADYEARTADGQSNAFIVTAWRQTPPAPGAIYERRYAANQPKRSVRDSRRYAETITDTPAWMADELAGLDEQAGDV